MLKRAVPCTTSTRICPEVFAFFPKTYGTSLSCEVAGHTISLSQARVTLYNITTIVVAQGLGHFQRQRFCGKAAYSVSSIRRQTPRNDPSLCSTHMLRKRSRFFLRGKDTRSEIVQTLTWRYNTDRRLPENAARKKVNESQDKDGGIFIQTAGRTVPFSQIARRNPVHDLSPPPCCSTDDIS